MTIHWDDKFSVGHAEIDKQHKTIIGLINQLKVDVNHDYIPQIRDFTLKEMIVYADNHLAYEERILEEAGYPDLVEHKSIHDSYRLKLKELQNRIDIGEASVKEDMLDFFNMWWEFHIREEDLKFRPYVECLGG